MGHLGRDFGVESHTRPVGDLVPARAAHVVAVDIAGTPS
jgi:hypothetical protein